ncbi:hypothetical protein B7Z17_03895 [Candidatus Saccharibacteria bacterium 32-49-10]|nr:MAG: hypothetical protein B7Z17_03895 [Candidatus Saccharibacteria bacterium 32-49-10]
MELLIVIVVVGILATISIVAYNGVSSRANDSKRKDDVAKIAKAMQLWTVDTGKSFREMNTGWNSNGATGWHSSDYGGGSLRTHLANAGYLSSTIEEPARSSNRGYLVAVCTNNADNRRVVMAQLDSPPTQTLTEQISSHSCANSQINSGIATYGANYAIVVGG